MYENTDDAPRPMLEYRNAATGHTERKDDKPNELEPGEKVWIAFEMVDPKSASYRIDNDGAVATDGPHAGGCVFPKKPAAAERDWEEVDEDDACARARECVERGVEFPTTLIATTLKSLGIDDAAAEAGAAVIQAIWRGWILRNQLPQLLAQLATGACTIHRPLITMHD